jgi:hypothetical protein
MLRRVDCWAIFAWGLPAFVLLAAEPPAPPREQVQGALTRAVVYFHEHCAKHGGYDWRYSRDFKLTEGEEETGPEQVWVQPPGTPAVGIAMLEACQATGDQRFLDWAQDAAEALVQGQMQSCGWHYSVQFDPAERKKLGYRNNSEFRLEPDKVNKRNLTTLDDDTTCGALRCMMRVDAALQFKNAKIHEAALYCLDGLLKAQYPNGGWSQKWDRYQDPAPSANDFPVKKASYSKDWSREWLNDWPGRYFTNDNVTGNMIATLIEASKIYKDARYLDGARKTGDFLLLAQLPAPQSGWAQQYDKQLQPCWDRKFEPPALASDETQESIAALLQLYAATGETKYLAPIPKALDYLRTCLLPDGQLARFYELQTNKPLYFDKKYKLTYDSSDVPSHYAFFIPSRIAPLQTEYEQLKKSGPPPDRPAAVSRPAASRVIKILDALDSEGAWVSPRGMTGYNKASPGGVIESEVFVKNAGILSKFLLATPK